MKGHCTAPIYLSCDPISTLTWFNLHLKFCLSPLSALLQSQSAHYLQKSPIMIKRFSKIQWNCLSSFSLPMYQILTIQSHKIDKNKVTVYPWLEFLLLRHRVLHASIVLEPTSTLHDLLSQEKIFSRTRLFGKQSHICWCLVNMCWVDPWLAVAWFVIFCSKLIRRLAFSICSSFCNSCLIFLSVLVDGQTTLPRSNLQLSSEQRRPQSRSYFYTRMLRKPCVINILKTERFSCMYYIVSSWP